VVVGALDVADPLAERFADGRQHRALQAGVHSLETYLVTGEFELDINHGGLLLRNLLTCLSLFRSLSNAVELGQGEVSGDACVCPAGLDQALNPTGR
jgi:hypothetical protein